MTLLFEWKPEYSVSVERFDHEHKVLFGLLNELNTAMAEGRGRTVVSRILRELSEYCLWHFGGEEDAMRRAQYPELDAHIAEHQVLSKQVQEYYDEVREHRMKIPIDVLYFMRDWLVNHILKSDRAYSAYMSRAGIH